MVRDKIRLDIAYLTLSFIAFIKYFSKLLFVVPNVKKRKSFSYIDQYFYINVNVEDIKTLSEPFILPWTKSKIPCHFLSFTLALLFPHDRALNIISYFISLIDNKSERNRFINCFVLP